MPQPHLPVVSHVDPAVLLGPPQSESQAYRRMIDGRTAYQQILFVEPRLLACNPPSRTDASGAPVFVPPSSARLRGDYVPVLPVTTAQLDRLMQKQPPGRDDDRDALQDTGLSSFPKLVCANPEATLSQAQDIPQAARLLATLSFDLLVLWVRAETRDAACFDHPLPTSARHFLDARGDVFAASVLAEFCTRLGRDEAAARIAAEIEAVHVADTTLAHAFGTGTDFPLCRELIAYWLPLWNRHNVIFNSPFDLMSNLETFA